MSDRVFHYAPWSILEKIIDSGALVPSNAGAPNEIPLLWFSKNPKWEPTATKLMRGPDGRIRLLSFDEQHMNFGCVRFGLSAEDPRLLSWRLACAAGKIHSSARHAMEHRGRALGARHNHWFATTSPVPLDQMSFEVLFDEWHPAEATREMAQAWANSRKERLTPAA